MFGTLAFTKAKPGSNNLEHTITSEPDQPRRRAQVVKACANCRAYRIKCDSEQPCRNCRRKGRQCDQSTSEVRTFASAVREIDRLNGQIQELQRQLQLAQISERSGTTSHVRAAKSMGNILPTNLDPFREHGGNRQYWECINIETKIGTTQCYGPSSLFYFIARVNICLGQQAISDIRTDAIVDRMNLVSNTDYESNLMHMAGPINRIYMERSCEEFYLSIYWEEYHPLYPIIEEVEFWNHHRSLWDSSGAFRQQSALVDMILAICLQHGTTDARHDGHRKAISDKNDEIIASRWFYRRSQACLTYQLETPSLSTLQTYILCVIYLCNANSHNAAHSMLSTAVRTGVVLGLHLEPPEHLPKQKREARKGIWWQLYALEMKMAMELGRPLAINISQVTCSLPSEETLAYTCAQQRTVVSKEGGFLSFSVHFIRLMLAMRAAYITFYDRCAAVLGHKKQKSLYSMPDAMEECAEFLLTRTQCTHKWLRDLPDALRMKRRTGDSSLSTDQTAFDVDHSRPRWQQQQSLILELHYHNFMMSHYRPFICFPPPDNSQMPLTDKCAAACLDHAKTMTSIIHTCLMKSNNLLRNHHEAFRWQWSATLAIIGYMMAYPTSTLALHARMTVQRAMQNFDDFAESFALALLAKQTTEELLARVSNLDQTLRIEEIKSHTPWPALQYPLAPPMLPAETAFNVSDASTSHAIRDSCTTMNIAPAQPTDITTGAIPSAADISGHVPLDRTTRGDEYNNSFLSDKYMSFSTTPLPWSSNTFDNTDEDFFRTLDSMPMDNFAGIEGDIDLDLNAIMGTLQR